MATFRALQCTRQGSQDKAAGSQCSLSLGSPPALNLHSLLGAAIHLCFTKNKRFLSPVLLRCPAVELLTAMKACFSPSTARGSPVPVRALRTSLRNLPTLLRGPRPTWCPDRDLAPFPPSCPGHATQCQSLPRVPALTLMTLHL